MGGSRREIGDPLDGYTSGPDAGPIANGHALAAAAAATVVLLVEGVSDQIAIETLARRQGRAPDGAVVVPMGGVHAVRRHLDRFDRVDVEVGVLCDAGEEYVVRRALTTVGGGEALRDRAVFVCRPDLEAELIRAAGPSLVEAVLAEHGDLGAFRTLQGQPAWRGRPFEEQAHRWLRAGSRRTLRYAALLTAAIPRHDIPRPLADGLAFMTPPERAARPPGGAAGARSTP